jgi:hypothetical protein
MCKAAILSFDSSGEVSGFPSRDPVHHEAKLAHEATYRVLVAL